MPAYVTFVHCAGGYPLHCRFRIVDIVYLDPGGKPQDDRGEVGTFLVFGMLFASQGYIKTLSCFGDRIQVCWTK